MAAVVSDLSPSAFDDKARADLLKGEGSGKSDVVGEVRYRYMVRRLASWARRRARRRGLTKVTPTPVAAPDLPPRQPPRPDPRSHHQPQVPHPQDGRLLVRPAGARRNGRGDALPV